MTPAYAAAYSALERDEVPRATSALNVLNRIGGAVGAAALAVVLAHGVNEIVPAANGDSGLRALAALGPEQRAAFAGQLAAVFRDAYWVLFGVTLVAFIPAAFLPRKPFRRRREAAPPPVPEPHEEPKVTVGDAA
jgi:hypothetical protein